MLTNDIDQETGFIMTQMFLQWSVRIAQIFTSVTDATCLFVKSEKSQIKKLLQLEAKDISLYTSAQSNGYGVTTTENRTST